MHGRGLQVGWVLVVFGGSLDECACGTKWLAAIGTYKGKSQNIQIFFLRPAVTEAQGSGDS